MTNKFNIAIITTSRSELGLLKGVIYHLSKLCRLTLLIGGSHLIEPSSYKEIIEFTNNLKINKVEINSSFLKDIKNLNPASQSSILGEMSRLIVTYLEDLNIDLLLMLGDRWELLSASISALFVRIPIAHISGGEVTESAIDENIRHSITKMSHLHFVACDKYAERVSYMGEEDWRIFISGETGLDWIHNNKIIDFKKTMKKIKLPLKKSLILFTYHPISYGDKALLEEEISEILISLKCLKEFTILITGPGFEIGSEYVRSEFKKITKKENHIFYHEHLGRENYLSLMSGAEIVLGNSSSGIVETPSFGVISINIGNRQNGRERATSTIDVTCSSEIIINTVRESVKNNDSKNSKRFIKNPYDPFLDGKNSQRVALGCISALNKFTKTKLINKKFNQTVKRDLWNTIHQ